MREKGKVLSGKEMEKAIIRIAHEILERNKGCQNLAIVGIRTRGAYLAQRLSEGIKQIAELEIPVGVLDITLYRDDLTAIAQQPVVHRTQLPFDITGKRIVLVDDVLYTGRTIRAALDELIDFGRPENIQLAILIDRGHRELPIRPDYVGKNVPTSLDEMVEVRLKEEDGKEEVVIVTRED